MKEEKNSPDEAITDFIHKQKTATVCCTDAEGAPYCFSCYYAFHAEAAVMYFKTSPRSHHASLLLSSSRVAGTILPGKPEALRIRGIQFTGEILPAGHELAEQASRIYHRRFPFALAIPGEVFSLRLDRIKMTDSRRGTGNKLKWERQSLPELLAEGQKD